MHTTRFFKIVSSIHTELSGFTRNLNVLALKQIDVNTKTMVSLTTCSEERVFNKCATSIVSLLSPNWLTYIKT